MAPPEMDEKWLAGSSGISLLHPETAVQITANPLEKVMDKCRRAWIAESDLIK